MQMLPEHIDFLQIKHLVPLQSKWLFKPLGYGEVFSSSMLNESPGIYCQKGQMEQVCDELVHFPVSFGFPCFHKGLGHALCCSSPLLLISTISITREALVLSSQNCKRAHKLLVPPTLVFSGLK